VTTTKASSVRGFVFTAVTFVSVFIAGASILPLYDVYRRDGNVTDSQLSLVSVAYFVAAVATLLVLGRLSSYIGRRPVTLAALILAIAGCVILLDVRSVAPLIIGRALIGIATGLASSALVAWVADLAPAQPAWLGPTIASTTPMAGFAIGALGAGLLATFGPAPRQFSFIISIGLLIVCLVGVLTVRESVTRNRGARASLRPRLVVPQGVRRLMPLAFTLYLATWAFGG